MKKLTLTCAACLTIMFSIFNDTFAQGVLPGDWWWTGMIVQNISSSSQTFTVKVYDTASGSYSYTSPSISANKFLDVTPLLIPGLPNDFQGSVVVQAAADTRTVVNHTNRLSGSLGSPDGFATAQHQGIGIAELSPARELYFPLVKGNQYDKTTTFYIQNASNPTNPQYNANVTATFRMNNGNDYILTFVLAPNRMHHFNVFDAGFAYNCSQNQSMCKGTLVVTSDQPIAGIVFEHMTNENPATILQSTRAFTSSDFDDTAFAPLVKNRINGGSYLKPRFTGISVMNVSSQNIDITVDYKGYSVSCAGNTYSDSQSGVQPNHLATFNQINDANNHTNLPENCTASAKITATGSFIAVVNESYVKPLPPGVSRDEATTYSALPLEKASRKISVPLFKDRRYQKNTGLQIQNVGDSTEYGLVAKFYCQGAATFEAWSQPQTVAPGASIQFHTPSVWNPGEPLFDPDHPFSYNNVTCSVIVTSLYQPMIAIAQESADPQSGFHMDTNNYEGFNLLTYP
jgi:hypothetical protein